MKKNYVSNWIIRVCIPVIILIDTPVFGQTAEDPASVKSATPLADNKTDKPENVGWANYMFAFGADFIVGQLPLTLSPGFYVQFRPVDFLSIETHPVFGYSRFEINSGVPTYIMNMQIYSSINLHFPGIPGAAWNISLGGAHGYSAYGHAAGVRISLGQNVPSFEKYKALQEYSEKIGLGKKSDVIVRGHTMLHFYLLYNFEPAASANVFLQEYYKKPDISVANPTAFNEANNLMFMIMFSGGLVL